MKSVKFAALALSLLLSSSPLLAADVSGDTYVQGWGGFYRKDDRSGPYSLGSDGVARLLGSSAASSGATPGSPTYVAPAGVTRSRITCTLPAYASGGNVVCTDSSGQQTTTACAVNTACLISAANTSRKVAEFTNRTAGTTIDVGYSASVAPGTGKGYDGPSAANGQGGSGVENPAHVGAYYAASASVATLVFIQGQ